MKLINNYNTTRLEVISPEYKDIVGAEKTKAIERKKSILAKDGVFFFATADSFTAFTPTPTQLLLDLGHPLKPTLLA